MRNVWMNVTICFHRRGVILAPLRFLHATGNAGTVTDG
jgi:hypothetical protein